MESSSSNLWQCLFSSGLCYQPHNWWHHPRTPDWWIISTTPPTSSGRRGTSHSQPSSLCVSWVTKCPSWEHKYGSSTNQEYDTKSFFVDKRLRKDNNNDEASLRNYVRFEDSEPLSFVLIRAQGEVHLCVGGLPTPGPTGEELSEPESGGVQSQIFDKHHGNKPSNLIWGKLKITFKMKKNI